MDERRRWEDRYREASGASAPSSFVVKHADSLGGRILDVAAGSGRNGLYLASRGARVEAIDRSWNGLAQAKTAAAAGGFAIDALQADLESYPLPVGRYDAVLNIRYLQRSLFPSLQAALRPGGLLLFETFLIDQRALGHPRNPEFLLDHGELLRAFAGLEVIDHEEGRCEESTGPVYLARLLARAPRA